jgi:hypothetical protein
MQGTLTCYFCVGNELYAISARHNFFVQREEDAEFNFDKCTFFFSMLREDDASSDSIPPFLRLDRSCSVRGDPTHQSLVIGQATAGAGHQLH